MELTTLDMILLTTNIVFIIISVFLFIRLRKIEKKSESEVKKQTELSGTTDITPVEFNRERFRIEESESPRPEKTIEAGDEEKIEASKIAEIKREDKISEVEENVASKTPEKIEIPEKIEFKFEEKEPEKEEEEKTEKEPEKKATKKKKPVKKEPSAKQEPKPAPKKNSAKKKKV